MEEQPQNRSMAEADPPEIDGQMHPDPEAPEAQVMVNLPNLFADQFGMSPNAALTEIRMGHIEIDDVRWDGDRINIPASEITGKTIALIGQIRHFKMEYKPDVRA